MGVTNLVAVDARVALAVLVELPDGDQHVGAEHHHAGTGRQPVQTVGEVHPGVAARQGVACPVFAPSDQEAGLVQDERVPDAVDDHRAEGGGPSSHRKVSTASGPARLRQERMAYSHQPMKSCTQSCCWGKFNWT